MTSIALASAACASTPQPIEAEIGKTPPGQITVVEFVDYECHFCQKQHAAFAPLLDVYQGQVRVVVKHVPLDEHPGARRAAEAAICAEAQGKLPAMHEALMKGAGTGDDDLLNLAQHAALDVEQFKTCLRSDAPATRLKSDLADYRAAGGDGLPTLFIQRQKIVGFTGEGALESALREASASVK
jgi:protein-disulfide isomerase